MNSERQHSDCRVEEVSRAQQPAKTVPAPSGPMHLPSAIGNRAFASLVDRSALASQGAGPLDESIAAAIGAQTGQGAPLPAAVRTDMEGHFGYDLSSVRVHTGAAAAELNTAVQAEAFTTGSDIFFRPGAYDPSSSGGRELLAHELTHVVQQAVGTAPSDSRVSSPSDRHEVQASQVARSIAAAPVRSEEDEQ